MRLLFVADLHYTLRQFDWLVAHAHEYDVVAIGGDLLDLGSILEIDVQSVVIEKYLARIGQKTQLLVSSGNHDGDRRDASGESIAQWLLDSGVGQVLVDGDSVEIDGVLFTICPWWDGPRAQASLEALLAREAARAKAKWVWIHHAPPLNSLVSWTGKKSGGDEILVQWIEHFQPDVVLSGHIHNAPFYSTGSWVDRLGKTWVFNPGKQIGSAPTYLALDFETMTAEWVANDDRGTRSLAETDAPALSPPLAAGVDS